MAYEILLAASPNCFLEFHPFVAYRYFPSLGIKHVEVPAAPNGTAAFSPEALDGEALEALKERLSGFGVERSSAGSTSRSRSARPRSSRTRRASSRSTPSSGAGSSTRCATSATTRPTGGCGSRSRHTAG